MSALKHLIVAFTIVILFACAIKCKSFQNCRHHHRHRNHQKRSYELQQEESILTQNSLISVLETILNDPEFLQLTNGEQLQILIYMYSMIESHYERKFLNKNSHVSVFRKRLY
jgi:hypothetical protein